MKTFSLQPEAHSAQTPKTSVLDGLNGAQREAAETTEGAVMIIAGAGSGKTRTVTFRIAHILEQKKAFPSQILALTFTNKAAKEMQQRIGKLIGEPNAKGLAMGTFHSIFSRFILRREAEKLGYTSDFTVYDSEDAERIVKNLLQQHGYDTKQFQPRAIFFRISAAKNMLVSPAQYRQTAATLFDEAAAKIFQPYLDFCKRSNAMDFDDLLIKPIELFQKYPDVLEAFQNRWKYIHIDEYQDTNFAQYTITKMLAAKHKNICIVGDDAQSIYAFRGADISNILNFKKDYPDCKVIRLEQNYRSTQKILNLADSIIKHNKDQLKKTLWTENVEGADITLLEGFSERDEAQKIEGNIRHINLNHGYPYRSFAILYRTNAQSRALEDGLRKGGIPYKIIGGTNFYQRREIKDAIAYLRIMVNPNDNESLRRIINTPPRGIGEKTVETINKFAALHGISMWQAVEKVNEIGVPTVGRGAVERFGFMLAKHAAKLNSLPADELARQIIQDSGILGALREENTPESLARWENVQELLNAIAEFHQENPEEHHLSRFLQEVALLTDADKNDENPNFVTLMTLHASKGLEFPVVFLAGMEENLFPLQMATQSREELEEERRLLYVGITRAEQKLFLSYARSRFKFGQTENTLKSRFLDEMDPSHIKKEGGGNYVNRQHSYQLAGDRVERSHFGNTKPPMKQVPTKKPTPKTGDYQVEYDADMPIVQGDRVAHDTFGEGKVLAMEGSGERAKATIFFKSVGQKKLALKFAKLRRI